MDSLRNRDDASSMIARPILPGDATIRPVEARRAGRESRDGFRGERHPVPPQPRSASSWIRASSMIARCSSVTSG